MKLNKLFLRPFLPAYLVLAIILCVFILIPLFQSNPMVSRDLVGHVFYIAVLKSFLFPDFQGWNAFNNLGFPQGSYYPMFFQYVIAGLSTLGGSIEFWLKVLFSGALLGLPLCIYYFVNTITSILPVKEKIKPSVITLISLISFLVILLAPQTYSGSVRGTLQMGMITNFFALPFVFLFLGVLVKLAYRKAKFTSLLTILGALLLALLMLGHLVTGVIGLFMCLVLWIGYYIKGFIQKDNIRTILTTNPFFPVLAYAGMIVSFFYLPYLLNARYLTASVPSTTSLSQSVALFLVLLGINLYFFIRWFQKRNVNKVFWTICFALFAANLIPVVDAVSTYLGHPVSFKLVHAYRIFPYILYLGVPIVLIFAVEFLFRVSGLIRSLETRIVWLMNSAAWIGVLGVLSISLLAPRVIDFGQRGYGTISFDERFDEYLGANFLTGYTTDDLFYLHRVPYYKSIEGRWDNFSTISQFEESSYLNHFGFALKKALDPQVYSGLEYDGQYIENKVPSKLRTVQMLSLFNIGFLVLTEENNVDELCRKGTTEKITELFTESIEGSAGIKREQKQLIICQTASIETPRDFDVYTPTSSASPFTVVDRNEWDQKVIEWWQNEEPGLLLENQSGVGELIARYFNQSDPVDIASLEDTRLHWAEDFQSFSMKLSPEIPQLAVVKIQYNPRWHAYQRDASGNESEIPVYRVSPSLMLVEGKGEVTMRYEFSLFEQLLKIFSLTTLTVLIVGAGVQLIRRLLRR